MSSVINITHLARVCNQIANDSALESGFVPVVRLLKNFRAELRVRPLLVEGMIAQIPEESRAHDGPRWLVLVDSGKYPIDPQDIESECRERPLPARLRFTVAHELSHTLAFREIDGVISLPIAEQSKKSASALVRDIERDADSLTSLLLCPDDELTRRLKSLTSPIDVDWMLKIANDFGLSREALLNRLKNSLATDSTDVWKRPHLCDFAALTTEIDGEGTHVLRHWPFIANSTRGVLPDALIRLFRDGRLPFSEAFPEIQRFASRGRTRAIVTSNYGTRQTPNAESAPLEVQLERVPSSKGAKSLLLLRDTRVIDRIAEFEQNILERKSSRSMSS